jgi:hypothetical protein
MSLAARTPDDVGICLQPQQQHRHLPPTETAPDTTMTRLDQTLPFLHAWNILNSYNITDGQGRSLADELGQIRDNLEVWHGYYCPHAPADGKIIRTNIRTALRHTWCTSCAHDPDQHHLDPRIRTLGNIHTLLHQPPDDGFGSKG